MTTQAPPAPVRYWDAGTGQYTDTAPAYTRTGTGAYSSTGQFVYNTPGRGPSPGVTPPPAPVVVGYSGDYPVYAGNAGSFQGLTPGPTNPRAIVDPVTGLQTGVRPAPSMSSFWGSFTRDILGVVGFIPGFIFGAGGGSNSGSASPSSPFNPYTPNTGRGGEMDYFPFDPGYTGPPAPASGVGVDVGLIPSGPARDGYLASVNQAVSQISTPASTPVATEGALAGLVTPGNLDQQTTGPVTGVVTPGNLGTQPFGAVPGLVTPGNLAQQVAESVTGGIVSWADIVSVGEGIWGVVKGILGVLTTLLPFLKFFLGAAGAGTPAGAGAGIGAGGGGGGAAGGGELVGAGEGPLGFLDKLPLPVKVAGGLVLGVVGYAAGKKILAR